MKKTTTILLSVAALYAFTGCSDVPHSSPEAKVYSKTPAEVYAQSCVKCHGKNGEGNVKKKAPALNDRQAGELELDLYDVKNGGTNQSSGTEHEIMEHNMQKLLAKGYNYDPGAMAEYIEKSFYKLPPKGEEAPAEEAAPAPEETPAAEAPAQDPAPTPEAPAE